MLDPRLLNGLATTGDAAIFTSPSQGLSTCGHVGNAMLFRRAVNRPSGGSTALAGYGRSGIDGFWKSIEPDEGCACAFRVNASYAEEGGEMSKLRDSSAWPQAHADMETCLPFAQSIARL